LSLGSGIVTKIIAIIAYGRGASWLRNSCKLPLRGPRLPAANALGIVIHKIQAAFPSNSCFWIKPDRADNSNVAQGLSTRGVILMTLLPALLEQKKCAISFSVIFFSSSTVYCLKKKIVFDLFYIAMDF
jgi:hypothetical protein